MNGCYEIINEYGKEIKELSELNDFLGFCVNKLDLKKSVFNVIMVNNDYIHNINRKYRNIDRETDVISFALEEVDNINYGDFRLLGDIYISYDKVLDQALEYNHSVKREICFLAIHGLLHLLGYDHMKKDEEEKMFSKQKELLDLYGIKK